jgi:ribosomal protein L24
MVVDPETDKPTRVARKRLEDGKRVRIAKRSGAILDK